MPKDDGVHNYHFGQLPEMPWNTEDACSSCGTELIVPAYGPKNSPVLLIGEFPGNDEVQKGIPFVGKTGNVLRTELALKGIDLNKLRRCNLWMHLPNKNEDCLKAGIEAVVKESSGKQVILLIGSETVKFLCKESVSSVNGLTVKSMYLSAPTIIACVQPATVFHGAIGELRFAMGRFSDAVNKLSYNVEMKEDEWE